MLKKLLAKFKAEWTPRLCDAAGFALLVLAAWLAFGTPPALTVAAAGCLLAGWALST